MCIREYADIIFGMFSALLSRGHKTIIEKTQKVQGTCPGRIWAYSFFRRCAQRASSLVFFFFYYYDVIRSHVVFNKFFVSSLWSKKKERSNEWFGAFRLLVLEAVPRTSQCFPTRLFFFYSLSCLHRALSFSLCLNCLYSVSLSSLFRLCVCVAQVDSGRHSDDEIYICPRFAP